MAPEGEEMDMNVPPSPQEPENFAFVMNVSQLVGVSSFTLAPGHELRRATSQEVEIIRTTIARLVPPSHMILNRWEGSYPPGAIVLPESEWRYFVIAFSGPNGTVGDLGHAFDLAPLELEIAFTRMGNAVVYNHTRLYHVLTSDWIPAPSFFREVSASDIAAIQSIHSQLQDHDKKIIDIRHLVTELSQLKGLPHGSPLRFLGYFALLEALLTHVPKPSDPYDSITRQVQKKLALLTHRWSHGLDYAPFGEATHDTIWSKMYSYRSRVAHGELPTFTGELQLLRDHDTALALIKGTVKAVMRQTLTEPQLVIDLREC